METAETLGRLKKAISEAEAFARQIERGQAANPLTDHFTSLREDISSPAFSGCIMPTTTNDWEKIQSHPELTQFLELLPPATKLASDPGASQALAKKSQLVVLAGQSDNPPDGPALDFLEVMIANAANVIGLLMATDATKLIERDTWLGKLIPESSLLCKVGWEETTTNSFSQLLDPAGPFALACVGNSLARRFEMALEMLADRLGTDQRTLEGRRRTLAYRVEQADGKLRERNLREASDAIRFELDEVLSGLANELSERQKLRCANGSPGLNVLDNFIEDLATGNLGYERTAQRERVRLDQESTRKSEQKLHELVSSDLQSDTVEVNERVELALEKVQTQLKGINVSGMPFERSRINDSESFAALQKLLVLDLRAQGELPKRTFIDRLNYGRRPVFLVMTVGSLVGAAFGARSGLMIILAPVMLLLFIAGIFWTFRSFANERQEQLERVLSQIREAVRNEFRKLYETASRDWLGRVNRHLADTQKDVLREVNGRIQESLLAQSRQQDVERQDIRDKLKILEGRLRELNFLTDATVKLRRTGADCRTEFLGTIRNTPGGFS